MQTHNNDFGDSYAQPSNVNIVCECKIAIAKEIPKFQKRYTYLSEQNGTHEYCRECTKT